MSTRTFEYVGTRPVRHDGVDKVTGRAAYGADLSMPGLLHGAILRSPHAHARIKSIDTSAAEKLPGVKAVVTRDDFPETKAGTPGFLVASRVLLEHNSNPTDTEIRYWLAGNLCRCTGYDKIVRAVQDAAAELRAGR